MISHLTSESYEIRASRYVRGMQLIVVPPEDDLVTKTKAAKLAEALCRGRYSYRECGYLANAVTVRYFMRALRLGVEAVNCDVLEWTEPGGARSHRFSAKYPRNGFAACKVGER